MRICHITSAHPRYDIRIFIKECQSLVTCGHEVNLIVADNLCDESYTFDPNYSINIYDVGKERRRLGRMLKTPQKIYQKVLELNPEVVHFHDPELMLIALKLIKNGFKVIYDVHEDLPKQIQNKHWLPKFSRNIISTLAGFLESFVAKRIIGIVAATPIIAARFEEYNANTVTVCNYPILKELDFSSSNVPFAKRENTLCYIGSIAKPRGVLPLIESLSFSRIQLELAGSISSDLSLEELKSTEGYQYVNYHGILNREKIRELLSRVKIGIVTLLPTPSYLESLPIKMFEYMLAGIPVIAANFPLWEKIITKYDCGVLVNPSNSEEIAKACEYLMTHESIAEEKGQNGRNAVIKYFNWEEEEKVLLSFYNSLNGSKSVLG